MLHIIVVLANDALEDESGSCYIGLGTNTLARLDHARQLAERLLSSGEAVGFAFGATADSKHQNGPTLGELMGAWMLEYFARAPIMERRAHVPEAFGTQPELTWSITAWKQAHPEETFCFHVVTQRRHMKRVRLIKYLWHPRERVTYQVSHQSKEIPLRHEILAYGALLCRRLGLQKVVYRIRETVAPTIDRA